jgi:hypothetical protein
MNYFSTNNRFAFDILTKVFSKQRQWVRFRFGDVYTVLEKLDNIAYMDLKIISADRI